MVITTALLNGEYDSMKNTTIGAGILVFRSDVTPSRWEDIQRVISEYPSLLPIRETREDVTDHFIIFPWSRENLKTLIHLLPDGIGWACPTYEELDDHAMLALAQIRDWLGHSEEWTERVFSEEAAKMLFDSTREPRLSNSSMRYSDIPRYTSWGSYRVEVDWKDLHHTLQRYRDEYDLDLDPDFQRAHVWSESKKVAYVEYILRGGRHSRDLIFNCPQWGASYDGQMVLVDGKQRLDAVLRFLDNELPILGGVYRKDLHPIKVPREYLFVFHINNLQTRREVLQFYLDLNSGGVVHTEEELNHVRSLLSQCHV